MILALCASAFAGDFVDTWITTALEETNALAGPDDRSPAPNFVMRGNQTFFEQYETKYSDDISMTHLVLYRKDDGWGKGVFTEAAFVVRMQPYLDPDFSSPGLKVADDGSYVRIGTTIGGNPDHTLSFTGYATDANRFRLGYSYDITWGGTNTWAFDPYAAPGARLQWQLRDNYAFIGAKTAVGDYQNPETENANNEAYLGVLAGAGFNAGKFVKVEVGGGWFNQGQLTNVADTSSILYNAPIYADGVSAQLSFRTTEAIDYISSSELKLYRNSPDFLKDSYISHAQVDGFAFRVQAEGNLLFHNLISPTESDSTVVENAFAGDVQATALIGSTEINLDGVYKDLSYIVFNTPGLSSGYAINPELDPTPQVYLRGKVSHFFEKAHLAPSLGAGFLIPASYTTSAGSTYVVYSEVDKRAVPAGYEPANILSAVAGLQWDVSKSTVVVGEVLYTLDNNESDFEKSADGGESGTYVPAEWTIRNKLGFNLMARARF